MRPWKLALFMLISTPAFDDDALAVPPPAATSTVAVAVNLSPEELELARYLTLLENMELLDDWEMLELWPLLEDEGEEP